VAAANGKGGVTKQSAGGVPIGEVTPEEAAKIRSSVAAREQAPSSRAQASFVNWRRVADVLGQPFEVELIPISKLRAMRRDPMLGFGLSFIKTPIVRARWYINAASNKGPNAQVAAHLDHDLRRIYAAYILQYANSLDFGFQALVKRFELRIPAATFIETNPESGEQEEKPVWDQGSVQPIGWKTFIPLPPEYVEPLWTGQGDFNGIDFAPAQGTPPAGIPARTGPDAKGFKIDLYHALWITNERDQNFGSIYGYPRLGYAYRYWWSYWFRWAIADRAFERKADPSVIVRHPEGEFVNEQTGEVTPYNEYALLMGERMRSGGVIAIPSEPYLGEVDGKPSSTPQWEVDFTKDATNFEPFDKSFDYLDVQKLRSLWIPEQAFLEGKGGTSSRNVAAELGESFVESQAVLAAQIVESINRWVIPQWLAVNWPDFLVDGGKAELIMKGFADQDVEFTKQIVQLVGQNDSGVREMLKLVDLKSVLEDAGTPILPWADQQRRQQQLVAEAQAAAPPAVSPVAGQQVGVVPSIASGAAAAGAPTNGGSATGFAYINPPEVIVLSDTANDFLANLPPSPHYADRAVKGFSRQLWTLFHDLYVDEYETAFATIRSGEALEFTDTGDVELAFDDWLKRAAQVLSNWEGSQRWPGVLQRSIQIMANIMRRAARVESQRSARPSRIQDQQISDWINGHVAEFASQVSGTTRTELREFVAKRMSEGVLDRDQLEREARAHFSGFPDWKTDRLVRTEVRDAYNAATLLTARANDIPLVQASDAKYGVTDAECMERDGEIFTVDDALGIREHPNGTLSWRWLPVNLSIEYVDDVGVPDALVKYDKATQRVLLSNDVSPLVRRQALKLVGERANDD